MRLRSQNCLQNFSQNKVDRWFITLLIRSTSWDLSTLLIRLQRGIKTNSKHIKSSTFLYYISRKNIKSLYISKKKGMRKSLSLQQQSKDRTNLRRWSRVCQSPAVFSPGNENSTRRCENNERNHNSLQVENEELRHTSGNPLLFISHK